MEMMSALKDAESSEFAVCKNVESALGKEKLREEYEIPPSALLESLLDEEVESVLVDDDKSWCLECAAFLNKAEPPPSLEDEPLGEGID